MFRRTLGLVAALVLAAAGSVAAQDVRYNAADTDFTKYKTYKWVTIEGVTYPDQIVDSQIKNAIETQFAKKGLTKTEEEKADLYVGYQLAVKQEREWTTYGMGGAWGYGPRWGGGIGTATSSTINIGMLGLDIYDSAAKQLVWRGQASKTLDEKANPEKRKKNLDKAMTKLMKNFPPPAKKK